MVYQEGEAVELSHRGGGGCSRHGTMAGAATVAMCLGGCPEAAAAAVAATATAGVVYQEETGMRDKGRGPQWHDKAHRMHTCVHMV